MEHEKQRQSRRAKKFAVGTTCPNGIDTPTYIELGKMSDASGF